MNSGRTAFSSLSLRSAEHLHRGLEAAKSAKIPGLAFKGSWINRRFVIAGINIATKIPAVRANAISLVLTVPSDTSATELQRVCHSFGATVELVWRGAGNFDTVVSGTDGDRHTVHRYCDAALCGHKPERWLDTHELGPLAATIQACPRCCVAASFKPAASCPFSPGRGRRASGGE